MTLILLHPEVAFRSCEDCQKYVYDHETGRREEWPIGSGRPVLRLPGSHAPCIGNPNACFKVSPDAGTELNERNTEAYIHYLECKAVGAFPDDPVVRANAAIIHGIESAAERASQIGISSLLRVLATRSGAVQIDG